jgi:hypothetical protein
MAARAGGHSGGRVADRGDAINLPALSDWGGGVMDQRDLDTYLRARRQQRLSTTLSILALVLGVVAGALLLSGVGSPVVKGVLLGSIGGAFLAKSELPLYSAVVSRQALLRIIENQIGRDPEALIYLAGKR